MTPAVTVIGSGATGVHFSLSVLRKGGSVRMLDVGRQGRAFVLPDAGLNNLKRDLEDPAAYFLGPRYESAFLPGASDEYYGTPPSKDYVFQHPDGFGHNSTGFTPLFSFARGGLAEAWTGGCYPLTEGEASDFPFPYQDLVPHYGEVARRIGISGERDDLERFMPMHDHLLPPLRLDRHSEMLMQSYGRVRDRLNGRGTYLGRTRVATLTQPLGARQACDYLGRCLWGCPRGSLYAPSHTLAECQSYPEFEYVPGFEVSHFRLGAGSRIRSIVGRDLETGVERELQADRVALAAGALLSTKIYLMTMVREADKRIRLRGLMDNRQVLVPFVNLRMLGEQFSPDSYQYHLIGMGLESASPRDYVHAQITTLKTALVHPLIQRLPFNLAASTQLFRAVHAGLGLVNVNLRDTRREDNYVELSNDPSPRVCLHYRPDEDESARISNALGRIKSALRSLRCLVPPGMTHLRPMGASVHYAGTLPMSREPAPFTTTAFGQSRDIDNLFVVDGATFPFLPAKNITFTLMANAVRVAEAAF